MLPIDSPYPQFFDLDGRPLDAGFIYIGVENQNPQTSPITVYWDPELTQPAAQPLRTLNGIIARNGTPAMVYAATDHSMEVQNRRGVTIYYARSSRTFSLASQVQAAISQLISDLASTGPGKGGDMVAFLQAGEGAVQRTMQDKAREVISVEDYREEDDTDDTASFERAAAYLQKNEYHRGGVIEFPGSVYKLSDSFELVAYLGEHNIILRGTGPNHSVFDFYDAPADTDGIVIGSGAHFGIENIAIRGAKRDGISIQGASLGSGSFASLGFIKNVRVEGSVRDGIRQQNTYMISMEDVWTKNNGVIGFNFVGFHTSIQARRCWANAHPSAGFSLNGMVYSGFYTCGSDSNMWGYSLSNLQGLEFSSCGSEATTREAWIVRTSNALAGTLPTEVQNIKGVKLTACYNLHGNQSAGGYATFISMVTADNRAIDITLDSCVSHPNAGGDAAIIADGASGRILIHENAPNYNGAGVTKANDVVWEGRTFTFAPAIVGLTSAGVGTYTTQIGSYYVQDGWVHAQGDMKWTAHTGTGNASVSNLPHLVEAGRSPVGVIALDEWAGITGRLGCYAEGGSTALRIFEVVGGGPRTFIPLDTAANAAFSISYPIQ